MQIIRAASIKEIFELVRLAQLMHGDSSFAGMDFDRGITAETFLRLSESDDGLLLLAMNDGEAIGGMICLISPSFFGNDKVASELGLFVKPDKRGSFAAVRMVREYVDWAKARGVKRINMGNMAGTDDARYVGLGERLGFTRAGSLLFMEV